MDSFDITWRKSLYICYDFIIFSHFIINFWSGLLDSMFCYSNSLLMIHQLFAFCPFYIKFSGTFFLIFFLPFFYAYDVIKTFLVPWVFDSTQSFLPWHFQLVHHMFPAAWFEFSALDLFHINYFWLLFEINLNIGGHKLFQ